MGDTRTATCTGKPASNTSWNTVSSITQKWDGTAWTPATGATYNTTASTAECRYTCNANYHTENAGVSCVSNTRSCTITNGAGTETRNGSTWGTCTVSSCNAGYEQNGNSCVQAHAVIRSDGQDLMIISTRGETLYAIRAENLGVKDLVQPEINDEKYDYNPLSYIQFYTKK